MSHVYPPITPEQELAALETSLSIRAQRRFGAAIARLNVDAQPPMTPAEAWGRAARSLQDGLAEFARQFERGFNHIERRATPR